MKKREIIISVIVIVLFVAFVMYVKSHSSVVPPSSETASITNQQSNTSMASSETTTASGLKVTVLQEGSGVAAAVGDTVNMNYTGTFLDGKAFDSNVDPKFGHVEPFSFTLGAHMVIAGWDEGVLGMKVGEKRHLVIPANLAYGAAGAGGIIPPNATLAFDVELVAISHK
jgi:FKBP-type peptidyl-prolyl cis-trans isomerase